MESRGFSAFEVGVLFSIMPACDMLLPPVWGLAADAWRARTWLLRVCSLASAGLVLLLLPADTFVTMCVALAVFCAFRAPLVPFADASTRAILGDAQAIRYGRVRVWGSVGFAAMAVMIGQTSAPAAWVFGAAAVFYGISAVTSLRLPSPDTARVHGVLQGAGRLLTRPVFLIFLAATTVHYVGHAGYDAYIGIHLVDLGYSRGFVGIAWGVGVVSEICWMFFAPRLIQRFGSTRLLPICAVTAGVRWLLLSTLVHPMAILAVQPLHAWTFGIWYVCLVDFAQRQVSDDLRSTVQALVIASMGLGRITGYLAGGRLLDLTDGGHVFAAAGLTAAAATALYLVLRAIEKKE